MYLLDRLWTFTLSKFYKTDVSTLPAVYQETIAMTRFPLDLLKSLKRGDRVAVVAETGPEFPFVALLVSGGHTQLLAVERIGAGELRARLHVGAHPQPIHVESRFRFNLEGLP